MKFFPRVAVSVALLIIFSYQIRGQSAQPLSLTIIDATTRQPVADAFVFFSGSSSGGISDGVGRVLLARQEYLDLVISHLNYATKVLAADAILSLTNNDTIALNATALDIDAVTVTSSDAYKSKRKKWLKRFEIAFLGNRRDRKDVRIQNPEAILFVETKTGLRVETADRIKIVNEALGYELSFLLDTFLLTRQNDVLYGGKVFFRDLESTQDSQSAGWRAARRKNYATSKSDFFQRLVRAEVDPQHYEIGQTTFTDDLDYVGYQKLDPDNLNWRLGPRADTLLFTGFLTVINREKITKWGSKSIYKVTPDEYATSFLRSRTGRFVISPTGMLLNNQEVEELGYWSEQRVARLLPTNYQPAGSLLATSPVSSYLDSLEAYRQRFPQEKIYLHLDKPYYSLKDRIWFSAYLLDASTHRPTTLSSVVHVDLIDPEGNIIQTLNLHQQQFLGGDFSLGPASKPGVYHLRAYTNYLRNGDDGFFFQRSLPVYDPAAIEDGTLVGVNLRPERNSAPETRQFPFRWQLRPESGTLVAGLENTVVLRLSDTLGAPLNLKGTVTDRSGNPVVNWATQYAGRGLMKFTPNQDNAYWLEVPFAGTIFRIPLPAAQASGRLLHVNNTREEAVFIKVSATPDQPLQGAFVIGHVQGEVFCTLNQLKAGEDIAFPRAQIPSGIASLALFAEDGELLGQRFFFNDVVDEQPELTVTTPYAFYRPRQEVVLELGWADSLAEQGASLSVSVTDRSLIYYEENGENIRNYLWLNSDALTPVDNPEFYLVEPDQRKRFLLDLQLIGMKKLRFNWQDLLAGKRKSLLYPPETTAALAGYISPKNKPAERVKAEVVLTALHPQPILRKVITDEAGHFKFSDLPYLDTVDYFLQAARFDAKKATDAPVLTSPNRKVAIHLERQKPAPLTLAPASNHLPAKLPGELLEKLADVGRSAGRLDSLYPADWQVDLTEVTVRGKRGVDARNFDVYDLNKLDWIVPEKPAYQLLTTLKPRNQYIREVSRNELQAVVNDGKGTMIRVPVAIIIDGFPATFSRFESLRADRIDYLIIDKRSIIVKTLPQPRSAASAAREGVLNVTHAGFYPGRPFPAPDYAQPRAGAEKPDLRTTIHWEPVVRLDAGGKAIITFFAADTPTEYEVSIEGITDTGLPVFKTFSLTIAD